jgi:hypothetical protein
MIREPERRDEFTADVAHLAEEVAELCIRGIEVFKTAAAALFDVDPLVAEAALELARASFHAAGAAHQKAIGVLARWAPTGDDLRRVVDLQRAGSHCARIAEHGGRAAEHARLLQAPAELTLRLVDPRAPDLTLRLVRQVYVALRGCLLLTATRERAIARRLVAEDAELERLHHELQHLLEAAIAGYPQFATTLQRLQLIAAEYRSIGAEVVAICEDRLYPASSGH